MNNLLDKDWNTVELEYSSQLSIIGGDWGDWVESFGYACGYMARAATDAAAILGNGLRDIVAGKVLEGAFR